MSFMAIPLEISCSFYTNSHLARTFRPPCWMFGLRTHNSTRQIGTQCVHGSGRKNISQGGVIIFKIHSGVLIVIHLTLCITMSFIKQK